MLVQGHDGVCSAAANHMALKEAMRGTGRTVKRGATLQIIGTKVHLTLVGRRASRAEHGQGGGGHCLVLSRRRTARSTEGARAYKAKRGWGQGGKGGWGEHSLRKGYTPISDIKGAGRPGGGGKGASVASARLTASMIFCWKDSLRPPRWTHRKRYRHCGSARRAMMRRSLRLAVSRQVCRRGGRCQGSQPCLNKRV